MLHRVFCFFTLVGMVVQARSAFFPGLKEHMKGTWRSNKTKGPLLGHGSKCSNVESGDALGRLGKEKKNVGPPSCLFGILGPHPVARLVPKGSFSSIKAGAGFELMESEAKTSSQRRSFTWNSLGLGFEVFVVFFCRNCLRDDYRGEGLPTTQLELFLSPPPPTGLFN